MPIRTGLAALSQEKLTEAELFQVLPNILMDVHEDTEGKEDRFTAPSHAHVHSEAIDKGNHLCVVQGPQLRSNNAQRFLAAVSHTLTDTSPYRPLVVCVCCLAWSPQLLSGKLFYRIIHICSVSVQSYIPVIWGNSAIDFPRTRIHF